MSDQHNTNNNQNTYRNNERSDSFSSNAHVRQSQIHEYYLMMNAVNLMV